MRRKKHPAEPLYFLMNKSAGTVCSTVSDRRHTVYEVFTPEQLVSSEGAKLHTVGRLDADTTGLLLFTNDGKLSNYLTRPESRIKKTYIAKLKTPVSSRLQKEYITKALNGLELPAENKAPVQYSDSARLEFLDIDENGTSCRCKVILTEGKFHEVKRLFRALKNEVTELKRIGMAGLVLDETLKEGNVRSLTLEELSVLTEGLT